MISKVKAEQKNLMKDDSDEKEKEKKEKEKKEKEEKDKKKKKVNEPIHQIPQTQKKKAEDKVYVLKTKPYENKFVNGSRPLPALNTPVPDDWQDANYVKQISTYSKKFLRDINDPHRKNQGSLVGKPVYLE